MVLASRPGLTAYGESGASAALAHRCPAWKLVVPLDGAHVVLDGVVRTGPVLVRPMVRNAASCTGAFVTVLADAWCWRTGLSVDDLPSERHLRAWARSFLAGTAGPDEVVDLLRPGWGALGPRGRAGAAAEALRRTDDLAEPARVLGLSPTRTRAVVRRDLGCTLSDVRRWLRLVEAYAQLGRRDAAGAATASGFADQAHLVRTSASLVGRTPGDVAQRGKVSPVAAISRRRSVGRNRSPYAAASSSARATNAARPRSPEADS